MYHDATHNEKWHSSWVCQQISHHTLPHLYWETWICCCKEQVPRMIALFTTSTEGWGESTGWYLKKCHKQPTDDACTLFCSPNFHGDWNSLVVVEKGHPTMVSSKTTWDPFQKFHLVSTFPPEMFPPILIPVLLGSHCFTSKSAIRKRKGHYKISIFICLQIHAF